MRDSCPTRLMAATSFAPVAAIRRNHCEPVSRCELQMIYLTIPMIAKHAGKHSGTVLRALKLAGIPAEKTKGVRGIRITLANANKFLARQWPEVAPYQDTRTSAQ